MKSKSLKPYDFSNYRDFLQEIVNRANDSGESLRSLSKQLGFSSPNYLQLILSHKRNLSPVQAAKTGDAIFKTKEEKQYFICLVKLDSTRINDKERVLEEMRSLRFGFGTQDEFDPSMHTSWLHCVVFEACKLENFDITAENLKDRLMPTLSLEEIQASIDLCLSKGWFAPTEVPNRYRQNDIKFPFTYGRRRLEIQQCHLRFLDLAKHRINADLDVRDFIGLTFTIPRDKLPWLQNRVRAFMDDINNEIEAFGPRDSLMRLQLAWYSLLK